MLCVIVGADVMVGIAVGEAIGITVGEAIGIAVGA